MRFVEESVIQTSPERLFAFHEQPEALKILIPPWEDATVIERAEISKPGTRAVVETKLLGSIRICWVAEHTVYDPPRRFEDVQISGPFKHWHHSHIVQSHKDGATLRDEIDYTPRFGFLGRLMAPWLIQNRLERLFAYRHQVTRRWCEEEDGGANT